MPCPNGISPAASNLPLHLSVYDANSFIIKIIIINNSITNESLVASLQVWEIKKFDCYISILHLRLSLYLSPPPVSSARLFHSFTFRLSPPLLHPDSVKHINYMVIDWPRWERLNSRLGTRVAHRIWLFLFWSHFTGGYLHEGHRSQSSRLKGGGGRALLAETVQGQ